MNRKQAISNVVLLGNGFDLYLGKKTSYNDFINNYEGKSYHFKFFSKNNKREKLLWIDLEKEIIELHKLFIEFDESLLNFVKTSDLVSYRSATNKYIFSFYDIVDGPIFPKHLYIDFMHFYFGITNPDSIERSHIEIQYSYFNTTIQKLIKDFNVFKKELQDYIRNLNENINPLMFNEILANTKYCINYNYTSTINLLNIPDFVDIKHIHGSVKDEIVFGVPWDMCPEKLKEISKEVQVISQNATFSKTQHSKLEHHINAKVHSYNGRKLSEKESELYRMDRDLFIIGHSLGQSDWHTLRKFIDLEESTIKFETIFISYYNIEAKQELIINLMNMLGKEKAEKMIEKEIIIFIQIDELNRLYSKES